MHKDQRLAHTRVIAKEQLAMIEMLAGAQGVFAATFFLFLAAASFRSIVAAAMHHAAAIPSLPAWCCVARSAVPTTEVAAAALLLDCLLYFCLVFPDSGLLSN